MAAVQDIVGVLADGHCHSGEVIAKRLGVSRTAIWKHLGKLRELGLAPRSVRGNGYQLPNPIELLNFQALKHRLGKSGLRVDFQDYFSTDSTNNRAMDARDRHKKDRILVCVAEHQSNGRGRHSRTWISPFGCNLYFSVGFWWPKAIAELRGLSLAVGVSLIESIGRIGSAALMLKWPNDVVHSDGKLAGVLVELNGEVDQGCYIVVGVGVNVFMPKMDGANIGQPWTTLQNVLDVQISRNELAFQLISGLINDLTLFQIQGFSPFLDRWQERDAFKGRQIITSIGELGIGAGITPEGEYILQNSGSESLIGSGEISIREANP